MADLRQVTNQVELDAALKEGAIPNISGDGDFDISAAEVVRVSGSSQPRVVCSGSSQPRVECYDSSQPRVVCYGSSQPRVVAKGFAQLSIETAKGSKPVHVDAGPNVSILAAGEANIKGGLPIVVLQKPSTAEAWCAYHGVEVKRGKAILFKAVEDDWRGDHKSEVYYRPGTTPVAPDWDGGEAECGGGLHFSPRPVMALRFCSGATHFLACPVKLADIAVHPEGIYPTKCKAKGCCGPVIEVDIDGEPVPANT